MKKAAEMCIIADNVGARCEPILRTLYAIIEQAARAGYKKLGTHNNRPITAEVLWPMPHENYTGNGTYINYLYYFTNKDSWYLIQQLEKEGFKVTVSKDIVEHKKNRKISTGWFSSSVKEEITKHEYDNVTIEFCCK